MLVPRELGKGAPTGSASESLGDSTGWVTEAGLRGDSGLLQCQKVLKKAQSAKELSCRGGVG